MLTSVWQIDRRRTTRGGNSQNINSNTPPEVTATPTTQSIARPATATLRISATDDGLPKRRGEGGVATPIGLTVEWAKYRGPGTVTWNRQKQPLDDGKADVYGHVQRAGRIPAAGGRGRWVGGIGRQLRLSLLLDECASEGDGDRGGNQRPEVTGGRMRTIERVFGLGILSVFCQPPCWPPPDSPCRRRRPRSRSPTRRMSRRSSRPSARSAITPAPSRRCR